MNLTKYDEALAVVRLGPGADLPAWAGSSSLLSVTATATETSVVCAYSSAPKRGKTEGPFTAYSVDGPLDFALTGVLAGLLQPLADAGVSVFTISTYDTDWILVPSGRAADAEEAWRRSGHGISAAQTLETES